MPVDISQLTGLTASLKASNGRVGRGAAKVVRATAEKVRAGASANANVRTGTLAGSFKVDAAGSGRGSGISATVSSDLRYAFFQEYGTSKNPPNPALNSAAEAQEGPFAEDLERAAVESLGL